MRHADIEAALVWRPGVLRRSRDEGTREFWRTLNLYLSVQSGPLNDENRLGTAAAGLQLEMRGHPDQAVEIYGRLFSDDDPLVKILGGCLLMWAQSDNDLTIRGLESTVTQVNDHVLRCSIWCKMMTFSLDIAQLENVEKFVSLAENEARNRPSMLNALRWVRYRYLDQIQDFHPSNAISDPRVDVREIVDLELSATRKLVSSALVARAKGVEDQSFSFGRTELDDLQAAELQATWSGAAWALPQLRKHLGAELLLTGEGSKEIGRGVSLWIIGGGDSLITVVDEAERHFEADTAKWIIETQLLNGHRPGTEKAFSEFRLAVWDLVPLSFVDDWLQSLRPSKEMGIGNHFDEQVWSWLALRSPTQWGLRFAELTDKSREAVVTEMPRQVAELIPESVATLVAEDVEKVLKRTLLVGSERWDVVDRLSDVLLCLGSDVADIASGHFEIFSTLPAASRIRISYEQQTISSQLNVGEAIGELENGIGNRLEEAHNNTFSFLGYDIYERLAMGAIVEPSKVDSVVDVLIRTALDIPSAFEDRLNSLSALHLIDSAELLPERVVDELLTVRAGTGRGIMGNSLPAELIDVMVIALTSSAQNSKEIAPRCVALSRHPDARVRRLVVALAPSLNKEHRSEWIESISLASLFDPDRAIIKTGIESLPRLDSSRSAIASAVPRLVELMGSQSRQIRASIIRTALKIDSYRSDSILQNLVSEAHKDRSWIVRYEASGRAFPLE